MTRRYSFAALLLLALVLPGCAPKELFSFVDRHCFVADWTNHHSCLSCCGETGGYRMPPPVHGEVLVLGDVESKHAKADEAIDDTAR